MIVNCDIVVDEKTLKRHTKTMLDLGLRDYSFYYKGHPATISIVDEQSPSPIVREYQLALIQQKKRVSLLVKTLLVSIILCSAITVCAYALSALL